MRRRDFLVSATGVLVVRGVAVAAGSRPRLALLYLWSEEAARHPNAALLDTLQRLGWIDGQTLDIDARYADGDYGRLAELARAIRSPRPDVIMANVPGAVIAAHGAAPGVPIVSPLLSDSVIPSLVASYGHPGGSVTGVTTFVEGMYGKLVEITRTVLPGIKKLGLLVNPQNADFALETKQIVLAAQKAGVELVKAQATSESELQAALATLVTAQVGAVLVPPNGLFISQQQRILAWSLEAKRPLVFGTTAGAVAGGLAGYGVGADEPFQLAALYIDKILKGAKPGDLAIEFPTKLELIINLKTAKTLGITVPQAVLNIADRVIE